MLTAACVHVARLIFFTVIYMTIDALIHALIYSIWIGQPV